MRFKFSAPVRHAVNAITQEWCGQVPPEMEARMMALALEDVRDHMVALRILTELEAIAARPSIKRRNR